MVGGRLGRSSGFEVEGACQAAAKQDHKSTSEQPATTITREVCSQEGFRFPRTSEGAGERVGVPTRR